MTVSLFQAGDLAVSVAALIGLWCLSQVLAAAGRTDPVVRRFRFGIVAVMLVYLGRCLTVGLGLPGWRWLEYLGAALIPLAVILLTESLLRRHAPPWVKAFAGVGSGVLVIVSVFPSALVDPARIIAALVFQVSCFVIAGWLVLRRNRASLSSAENKAAERLAFSLLLIIPLAASDFLIVVLGLPIRVSGLAVLVLCWLAIGLQRGSGASVASHGRTMVLLFAMILCGLGAGAVAAAAADFGPADAIAVGIVCLCAVVLSAVLSDARAALSEARAPSILGRLAGMETSDPVALFRGLAGHPAVEGAVFVETRDLPDLDSTDLSRLFRARPVLRRRDPPPDQPDLAEIAAHLFARYDASHLVLVKAAPLTLLAMSLPSIAAGARTEDELTVAQKLAASLGSANADR